MKNKPKLTKSTMVRLPIGAILPVRCETAAQLDAAFANAYYVRKKYPREDGGVYKISRSVKTMTVTVSVLPPEGANNECDKIMDQPQNHD